MIPLKNNLTVFVQNLECLRLQRFNIYARTVVRQRKIPFEITAENDPFYGESNAKILKESIEQMEQHPERNVVKTLEELEELADG